MKRAAKVGSPPFFPEVFATDAETEVRSERQKGPGHLTDTVCGHAIRIRYLPKLIVLIEALIFTRYLVHRVVNWGQEAKRRVIQPLR